VPIKSTSRNAALRAVTQAYAGCPHSITPLLVIATHHPTDRVRVLMAQCLWLGLPKVHACCSMNFQSSSPWRHKVWVCDTTPELNQNLKLMQNSAAKPECQRLFSCAAAQSGTNNCCSLAGYWHTIPAVSITSLHVCPGPSLVGHLLSPELSPPSVGACDKEAT
jgi:hypothetical protein